VDPSGTVLKVLKTHTDLDVDHLAYLPERFDLTALNQGGTRIALQAVWSDPDALTLFLLDDAEILTGAGATGSPALAGFAPAGGAPGTPVVITGTNFTGASLVVFGRDYAGGFTVDSDAQITALVPWDGATGPITVTTPAGTASSGASFFVSPSFISSPSCYGYSYNYGTYPEMSPDVAGVQDPVLLYGFNFTGATAVTFGGVPATQFTVTSNTQINVTVPAGAQNGPIVVTAPGGSVSTQGSFSVATPVAPFLAGAVPAAANPDATVTLSGTGLTTVNKVTFNGMPAVLFSMINDSTLTAVVPFGAGSGPVAVTNPAGSAAIPFTVLTPAIASVTPLTDAYPGTGVDIYGSGFLDASSVTIGGVAASFTIVSNTLITAVIPPSLRPIKTVNVIVVSPEGTSAPGLLNVYVPGPTVATVSPDSGPAGTTVTFTGQYLTNTYSVVFGGGCSASFNLIDDGHLTAVVPAGAMTGTLQISVLTGGNWTSSVPFTVQKPEVTIGQAPDNLLVGTTFAFSASATGTTASTVTWSVADGPAGGTIDASGLYTAPATPGQYYVIATSTSAPAVHSTVAVPVHSACLDPALTGSSGQPTVVDLAYFMAAMGSKVGDSNYNPLADLNGDGVIDNADLALFLAAF